MATLEDRAGLEIGIGFVAFAAGGMEADLYPVFTEAIARQIDSRLRFHELGPDAAAARLNEVFARTDTLAAHAAREALHAAGNGEALDPVHRAAWVEDMHARTSDLAVKRNRYVRETLELIAARSRSDLDAVTLRGSAGGLGFLAVFVLILVWLRRRHHAAV